LRSKVILSGEFREAEMTFQSSMKSDSSFLCRDCSRHLVRGQNLFFRLVVIGCASLGFIAFVFERSSLYVLQARQHDPEAEFKKLDANGDNSISADEFKAFRPSRMMPDLFKRLDRDGDGSLSLVEFQVVATMGSKARNAGKSVESERLLALSEPAIAKGTTTELERYRAASEYSARHAGLCLLIMKDGEIVFEQHVEGSSPEKAYQLASGTKSFWGPIAQVAISEGLFTLDEVVSETLTEWKGDPRKLKITVRDLLSFSSGLEAPRRLWAEKKKDLYKLVLELPATAEPGAEFAYSEVHLYAFGEFFKRKLAAKSNASAKGGERPWDYLNRKILTPIGLTNLRWVKDGSGDPAMGDGAVLTARQWAIYGEFLRLGGEWKGKQLVPSERLAECFSSSRANPAYGLTFWLNKASDKPNAGVADAAGAGRMRSSDQVSARGIVPGKLPDLVMAAGAGQQRLLFSSAEKLVIVRFANADMPRLVMAGKYDQLDLTFKDEEFFNKLLEPARDGKEVDRSPSRDERLVPR
jgi:CubicO group peptidase (beta-lactamase class C family)